MTTERHRFHGVLLKEKGGRIMFRSFVSATRASAISAAVLIGLVFTGVGRGAPDPTCTVEVTTGHSIQDAINSASSGDTICVGEGTYQENLLIAKDGITLKGAGPEKTVLEPPAHKRSVCVELLFASDVDYEIFNGVSGICVANVDAEGHELGVVNDVRVTGFTIHGFQGAGIVFANTNRPRADHNLAANNHDYGITAYHSTHGRFEYNTSYGSHDAGFYVGVSPDADFTVQDNAAFADLWGVLIRDSSRGRVRDNLLYGSCAGLVFWNTGITTGVHYWQASHNIAASNNNSCPAGKTELPFTLTGLGILIAGGDHIVVRENRVRENQPLGDTSIIDGVPLFSGGIVVVSTADISAFPGHYGSDASHNLILKNTVRDNRPYDLVYDGRGRGNHFVFNSCETSSPDGLCRGEKSEH
jgi:nitrous oxidase accessory protein NosD